MGGYLVGDGSLLVQLGAPLLGAETKAQRELMRREAQRDEEQEALVAQVGFSPEWGPRAEAERSPPCTKGCPRERERAHGTNEIPN